MKKAIDEADWEDLVSRLRVTETTKKDAVNMLREFLEVYKGLCVVYSLVPENNPTYAKALALVNANKEINF
jgi:hypothetical protein